MVPICRIEVMVHPRLGHSRNAAWPRDEISVRNRRVVGLVDGYGILRRDLLVQSLWLNSNEPFEKRYGVSNRRGHDGHRATYH